MKKVNYLYFAVMLLSFISLISSIKSLIEIILQSILVQFHPLMFYFILLVGACLPLFIISLTKAIKGIKLNQELPFVSILLSLIMMSIFVAFGYITTIFMCINNIEHYKEIFEWSDYDSGQKFYYVFTEVFETVFSFLQNLIYETIAILMLVFWNIEHKKKIIQG